MHHCRYTKWNAHCYVPWVSKEMTSAIQNVLFYTVIIDETTDFSNKEQVALVIRWVDRDITVHESLIGLYSVPAMDANIFIAIIKRFTGATTLEHEQNLRTVLQWRLKYGWCIKTDNIYKKTYFVHALLWPYIKLGLLWCCKRVRKVL